MTTMVQLQLTSISTELLDEILSYLDNDPFAICRLSCVNKSLSHHIIANNGSGNGNVDNFKQQQGEEFGSSSSSSSKNERQDTTGEHDLVSDHGRVNHMWKRLYEYRWPSSSCSTERMKFGELLDSASKRDHVDDYRREYAVRHNNDRRAMKEIRNLASQYRRAFSSSPHPPDDGTSTRGDVVFNHNFPFDPSIFAHDQYDLLVAIIKRNDARLYPTTTTALSPTVTTTTGVGGTAGDSPSSSSVSATERCIAAHIFATVHFGGICEDWRTFVHSLNNDNLDDFVEEDVRGNNANTSTTTTTTSIATVSDEEDEDESHNNDGNDNDDDVDKTSRKLEEGVVLASQCLWLTKDLTKHLLAQNKDDIEISYHYQLRSVRCELDRYGSELEIRLRTRRANSSSSAAGGASTNDDDDDRDSIAIAAVQELRTMLVDEMGYGGNSDNYYDPQNSSMVHVLKSKKGIPLTLSILYQLILRRVGVKTNIIGLPGHVVLGISDQTFVDVFDTSPSAGGVRLKLMSVQDARSIVRRYNCNWERSFLSPLSVSDVLTRLLNNIRHCHIQNVRANLSGPEVISAMINCQRPLCLSEILHAHRTRVADGRILVPYDDDTSLLWPPQGVIQSERQVSYQFMGDIYDDTIRC